MRGAVTISRGARLRSGPHQDAGKSPASWCDMDNDGHHDDALVFCGSDATLLVLPAGISFACPACGRTALLIVARITGTLCVPCDKQAHPTKEQTR